MRSGLLEIIQMGGPIMWIIFIGSVIAVGVFAERMIFYHRCSVPVVPFLKGIRLLLKKGSYQEALERCDEAYGPAVKVVQAAIVKRELRKQELREVIQEVAQLEMPRIEANLTILSTVAHVMPLLGLFGTVTGMIDAFQSMTDASGATPISHLAGGIWEALVTTAGGLGVAIPAFVAYNYLSGRVNNLISDMERAGIEVLQMLKDPMDDSGPLDVPTMIPALGVDDKKTQDKTQPLSDPVVATPEKNEKQDTGKASSDHKKES